MRLPDYRPYSIDTDAGLLRSPFEKGYINQRRAYTSTPMVFSLRFVMDLEDLNLWQNWWNENAYIWFSMPMASVYNGSAKCLSHPVRCISDLAINAVGEVGLFEIICLVELGDDRSTLPALPTDSDWVSVGNRYPQAFRLPDYRPYRLDVDMGVRRTKFAGGYTRQRRIHDVMPTIFSLRFVLRNLPELRLWQTWWDLHAYDWFEIPLASVYNGKNRCLHHSVRCISNLRINSIAEAGMFDIDCQVELNPDRSIFGVVKP